jgi:molybdate transport system substrate-binding protein
MRLLTLILGGVLGVSIGVGAVGAASTDGPLVLAASSLTQVLPTLAPDARASFGGSNQLAQQIRQGAPFDVYLSASPTYTRALYTAGLVRKPIPFATNTLVLIVPRANPAGIRRVADLGGDTRVRLVVAGAQVPIGLYTRKVLQRLDLLPVLRKAVSQEPDVKGVVAKVALGEADAGFVYATDVRPVSSKVTVIPIPARAQPRVLYELAIAAAPQRLEAAQTFVIDVLGSNGRRALKAAGFGLP